MALMQDKLFDDKVYKVSYLACPKCTSHLKTFIGLRICRECGWDSINGFRVTLDSITATP